MTAGIQLENSLTWKNGEKWNRARHRSVTTTMKSDRTLLITTSIVGAFCLLLFLEKRRPLRPSIGNKTKRAADNTAMAAISVAFMLLTELPITSRLTKIVEREEIGLLYKLPAAVRTLVGLVMLDYTIYIWHILLHKIPRLWRFHVAHHTDRDLDVFTALRFHFGELLLSIAWRSGQIMVIGVPKELLSLWQALFVCSILFHHSNVRLPSGLERALNWFFVSPRLHGIHHSQDEKETNSNWSSGLTIWDRLHKTYRPEVSSPIAIGVPAYDSQRDTELLPTLILPFVDQAPSWERRR